MKRPCGKSSSLKESMSLAGNDAVPVVTRIGGQGTKQPASRTRAGEWCLTRWNAHGRASFEEVLVYCCLVATLTALGCAFAAARAIRGCAEVQQRRQDHALLTPAATTIA
jgi:hypothetical protein